MDLRVFVVIFIFKLVSCAKKSWDHGTRLSQDRPPNVYVFDVNQLHEPLTNYDRAAKTVKYCIYMNNRTLDTNYLLGTWYSIYMFSDSSISGKDEYCPSAIFTTPTKEQLDEYKAKYNLQNETFTFDGAVLCSKLKDKIKGIVAGNKTAKYYFLDTRSKQRLMGIYDVQTYKPVNNDYLIYYECNMRGHIKYLWSKNNNPSDEELKNVLKPLYELDNMNKQRFCWKKPAVLSTTPYF